MWRKEMTPAVGTNQHTKVAHDNIRTHAEHGTSRAYLLSRLKEEAPKLFERVINKEMSARRAAIEAGILKEPSVLEQIEKLWLKLKAEMEGNENLHEWTDAEKLDAEINKKLDWLRSEHARWMRLKRDLNLPSRPMEDGEREQRHATLRHYIGQQIADALRLFDDLTVVSDHIGPCVALLLNLRGAEFTQNYLLNLAAEVAELPPKDESSN